MPTITKFYWHDSSLLLDGTLPGSSSLSAVTPSVAATGDSTNRLMDGNIGKSQVGISINTLAQTTAQTGWFRRFCSEPLAAQTLASGTWTISFAALESNANSNMLVFFRLYVWRPSTGATVATLISASTNSAEPGTTQTALTTTGSQASGQAIVNGDILVTEIWSSTTQGKASVFSNEVFYDGTTEASTSSCASFITAPAAITLLPPQFQFMEDQLRGDPFAIQVLDQAVNRASVY